MAKPVCFNPLQVPYISVMDSAIIVASSKIVWTVDIIMGYN